VASAVLDASAVLAVLFRETGADVVAGHIDTGLVGAVNHSEVLAKAVERGASIEDTVRQLARFEFTIVPFDAEQAALAASLRPLTRSWGLSLGDRACLALALKTSLPAFTADGDWEKCSVGVNVVKIR